jgi:cardiolipin synthase (CMP-forming)
LTPAPGSTAAVELQLSAILRKPVTNVYFKVWLAVIILGRDVGLAIAAIYYRWISLPPPKTFMRYWDFSLPSAEVRPTTISKYNTFLQLGLMGATMVTPIVTADVSGIMSILQ